ncbi:hypothetical protein BGS_1285 [Beggiatoa sp. SS]|nr:hypothetical protein BGS_1285 [Beggiatoa sp. SS]
MYLTPQELLKKLQNRICGNSQPINKALFDLNTKKPSL